MKNQFATLLFLLLLLVTQNSSAQSGITLQVNGQHIVGPCGDTLLLRGVNYAPYNWGWSPNELNLNELAQSGANCVRLPWYATGIGATPMVTYSDFALLDSVLAQCERLDLIPILELHDATCQNVPADVLDLATWFTQAPILALIDKFKHSIILNIANEALYVNWTANPVQAQTDYINTYTTAVASLRSSGITVPIMIDGPDCGTNLDVLAAVGPTLQQSDINHNLIFSAHAYWYAFANNDSATYQAKIDNALASGIPYIFGEVANLQDDQQLCQYALNYVPLLRICETNQIGWLAWSWDRDGCPARQITTAGSINSLTAYGNDILNSPEYGLLNSTPARSEFLVNNGCLPVVGRELAAQQAVTIFPNPSNGKFNLVLHSPTQDLQVRITDLRGKEVFRQAYRQVSSIEINIGIAKGIYLLQIADENGWKHSQRLALE
jgi:mannan endo-1,4-beta-mannosidase